MWTVNHEFILEQLGDRGRREQSCDRDNYTVTGMPRSTIGDMSYKSGYIHDVVISVTDTRGF